MAACHFTGGDRFPFEGCGRGLPVAMKDIAQVDFATIKHEVLLERELGPGFIGASDAELASRILDSPQKDRALELIHTDIAENKFGRWSLLGRTWGMIAGDDNSKRKECLFDVFASGDRKLIVMAHERRALCVWMILDDLFWGQASITGSAKRESERVSNWNRWGHTPQGPCKSALLADCGGGELELMPSARQVVLPEGEVWLVDNVGAFLSEIRFCGSEIVKKTESRRR